MERIEKLEDGAKKMKEGIQKIQDDAKEIRNLEVREAQAKFGSWQTTLQFWDGCSLCEYLVAECHG